MHKRNLSLLFFCLVITGLVLVSPKWVKAETVYVFANLNVPDSALTRNEVQNIYLGKKDKWEDNQKINFSALNNGACQETFIKEYVERSTFQFQNYWKKQIFTGKGQPPRGFDSDADIIDYVSRTSGAIGYSCTPPDTGKVKILTIN
jgi:ABC-type phosphate transport system substrate-binding protein